MADSSQTFTYLPCLSRLGAQPDGQQFGFCQAGLSATFLKVSFLKTFWFVEQKNNYCRYLSVGTKKV